MFRINKVNRTVRAAALAVAMLCSVPAARAAGALDYKKLIDQTAPALVTVKFVLKVQGAAGQREIEREFTGVMIGPKGLVLCSSVQLGTSKLMRRFRGTATPTDIKVLIGDDTEGVEAKLIASDSDLDLSWVQIKKPSDKGYAYVDFSKSQNVPIGAPLLTLSRMDKFFDRAVVINEGHLGGKTKKPRELLVPTDSLGVTPGMPVFAKDGVTVGVVVIQSPDPEDMAANPRMAGQSTAVLILPSAKVVKATKRAQETTKEDDEDDDGDAETKTAPAASQPAG